MIGKHANRLSEARGHFHPNLTSRSWENVYIRKLSLKTWRTPKKIQENYEKMRNRFLLLKATCLPCFKQYYRAVPSQKNLNFQTSQLHSHRWTKRNITSLRNQSELAPSHVESTDYVPPISSSSYAPQVFNRQPDLEEEGWCPNLQFDSHGSKPKLGYLKLKLDAFPFQVPSSHDPWPAGFFRLVPLAAENALNMCSVEVIRRFINRSWRWMSAYCMGLTGKATQRAVHKQKGLRCASRTAMVHLDAVLNGS